MANRNSQPQHQWKGGNAFSPIVPQVTPQEGDPSRIRLPQADPDDSSPIYAQEIGATNTLLTMDRTSLLNGIIFSEILGKPKSRRTGR